MSIPASAVYEAFYHELLHRPSSRAETALAAAFRVAAQIPELDNGKLLALADELEAGRSGSGP